MDEPIDAVAEAERIVRDYRDELFPRSTVGQVIEYLIIENELVLPARTWIIDNLPPIPDDAGPSL